MSIFKNIFVTICIFALRCRFVVLLVRSISIREQGEVVINGWRVGLGVGVGVGVSVCVWGGQTDREETMSHVDAARRTAEEASGCVFYVENIQTENVSTAFCFPFTMAVVELLL